MDVRMPVCTGVEATRRIKATLPDVRIVMLTVSEDEDDLFGAIKAGAQGYLLKDLESQQLRRMLDAVHAANRDHAGDRGADPGRVRPSGAPAPPTPDRLTERETDVLGLVTEGLRNKEIAGRLGISENTVKFHLRNILDKLHARSRAEIAALAVRQGLVSSGEPPAPPEQLDATGSHVPCGPTVPTRTGSPRPTQPHVVAQRVAAMLGAITSEGESQWATASASTAGTASTAASAWMSARSRRST